MSSDDRLGRFRAWMEKAGVAAAYLTDPISIAYLTGFHCEPHERLLALAVRPGTAALVVPGLEEESAKGAACGVDVVAWRDGDDPWALARSAIGGTDRLAVEEAHLTLEAWAQLDRPETVDAGAEIRRLRARKSPDEIANLETAGRLTDQVIAGILSQLRRGQTELEVAAVIARLIAETGGTPSFDTLVQSGPHSAQPHLTPSQRRLAPGDLVLIDLGVAWEGYRGDITRTVALGEADARQREVYGVVLAANQAAVAAVRPGRTVGEIDEAARSVIREAGLGDAFIHRVGHGLGLDGHEGPSVEPGGSTVLEEGMVITIEPGVYLPGWGGVRIEDDVVVEAAGGRLITHMDRSLALS